MASRKTPERPPSGAPEDASGVNGIKTAVSRLSVGSGVRALASSVFSGKDTLPPGFESRIAYQSMKHKILSELEEGDEMTQRRIRTEIQQEFQNAEHSPRGHVLLRIAKEKGIKPLPKEDLDKLMHAGIIDSKTGRPISEHPDPLDRPMRGDSVRPSRRPMSENPEIQRALEYGKRRRDYLASLPPEKAAEISRKYPNSLPPEAFTPEERWDAEQELRRQKGMPLRPIESRPKSGSSVPPSGSHRPSPRPSQTASPRPPQRPTIHPPAHPPRKRRETAYVDKSPRNEKDETPEEVLARIRQGAPRGPKNR